ncbi:hypothetical protein HNP86_001989 [Methanococcus maripaludis]|uniref:Uncharacterized protein n=1 Tax=Methanococcus maripaludis TaxID=39152 RepID=A0A7J9NVX2_METMI|nr:hypothetical protein [Methanococcus maripaludis]MBA2851830.1 hypothetical protein [Methanococcus maripaludis]
MSLIVLPNDVTLKLRTLQNPEVKKMHTMCRHLHSDMYKVTNEVSRLVLEHAFEETRTALIDIVRNM